MSETLNQEGIDNCTLTWDLEPFRTTWASGAEVLVWKDSSKRYKVCRMEGGSREGVAYGAEYRDDHGNWMSCEWKEEGKSYCKNYKSLRAALEAVEAYHKNRTGASHVLSNLEAVCDAALRNEPAPIAPEEERTEVMSAVAEKEKSVESPVSRIPEQKAREALVKAGYVKAESMPAKKLEVLINDVPTYTGLDTSAFEGNPTLMKMADRISEGIRLEVIPDENSTAQAGENGQEESSIERMRRVVREKLEQKAREEAEGQEEENHVEEVAPKRRGRPKGSKNKPKTKTRTASVTRVEEEEVTSEPQQQSSVNVSEIIKEIEENLKTLKQMMKSSQTSGKRKTSPVASPRETRGKGERQPRQGMSFLEAAEKVLGQSKKPLSAREVAEKISEKGYWTPSGKTPFPVIAGQMLSMNIKNLGRKSLFCKPERGRFALKK